MLKIKFLMLFKIGLLLILMMTVVKINFLIEMMTFTKRKLDTHPIVSINILFYYTMLAVQLFWFALLLLY